MQEEKQNSWRQKLEDTGSLQHAVLQHKDAAWEKLQEKLSDKPKRKVFAWYWVAAACILAAFVTIALLQRRNAPVEIVQNKINTTHKTVTEQKTIEQPINEQTNSTVVKNSTTENKQVTKQKETTNTITTTDTSSAIATVTTVASNDLTTVPQQQTIAANPDTTTVIAAIQPAEKKKLKVVHVNELGDPVEIPASIVAGTEMHFFQFKLAKQETYLLPPVAANKKPLLTFKPKISTN